MSAGAMRTARRSVFARGVRRIGWVLGFLGACASTVQAAAPVPPGPPATVRVCYNHQLGPPDGGHFSLMLIRAVQAHLHDLRLELVPLPWVRCLVLASRGQFDGILGASYTVERAVDLVYPRDPDGRIDDSKRLFSQGYRLLRRRGDAFDTDGRRFIDLVGPVGVERGHSTTALVRERGAAIDDSHPDVHALLAKLRSGRVGAVLVSEPRYASLRGESGALDGLEAVPTPLQPRTYFLVFSRDFMQRSPALAQRLWDEAARQRETPAIRRATARQQDSGSIGAGP